LRRLADLLGQRALHVHVDVFVLLAEREAARLDLSADLLEPAADRVLVRRRQELRLPERLRPREAAVDVFLIEPPVESDRLAAPAQPFAGALLEPSAPERSGPIGSADRAPPNRRGSLPAPLGRSFTLHDVAPRVLFVLTAVDLRSLPGPAVRYLAGAPASSPLA